jgi:hypothetical protein
LKFSIINAPKAQRLRPSTSRVDNLGRLRQALDDLGLAATTNIVITADHGFATVSKESASSPAAKASYPDVVPGFLPRGFLAIDIAKALDLPLFDPDNHNARVGETAAPRAGNGAIGNDAEKPEAIIAANGDSKQESRADLRHPESLV